MFISLCVTSPGTLSKRNATAMIETTICIFPIDRRSFVSRISQGGTLNDTKIRSDCVSVHVSTDFVSFLYITLTYRVDLFLIHWRSFLHSRVKDRTENRERNSEKRKFFMGDTMFIQKFFVELYIHRSWRWWEFWWWCFFVLEWSNKTRSTIDRSVVDDGVRFMVCVLETFLKSDGRSARIG